MTDHRVWQYDLIAEALAAGSIDESQALLLGMLYFHANWSTRVLADFRAELACEWLGHDLRYTRTMQKRLSALRRLDWFTWTYVRGIKVPYDITMRPQYAGEGAPPSLGDRSAVTVRESDGVGGLPVPAVLNLTPRVLNEKIQPSARDGGAPSPNQRARKLHADVYKHTDGEQIAQMLTPTQIETLLSQHSVDEIVYAVQKRRETVTVKREFHRSLRTFLLEGGVQIELDAVKQKLQKSLDAVSLPFRPFATVTKANTIQWVASGKYLEVGEIYNRDETMEERAERQYTWVAEHADELRLFPDVEYQAAMMYAKTVQQPAEEKSLIKALVNIGVAPGNARAAVKKHGVKKVLEDLRVDAAAKQKGKS